MSTHPIDLTGQVFNRLTVIAKDRTEKKHTYWRCQCSCGNVKAVKTGHLRPGHTQSCGCLGAETVKLNGARSAATMRQRFLDKQSLDTRKCSDCEKDLTRDKFAKNKTNPSGLANVCKACSKIRGRTWVLKQSFNLTPEDWQTIFNHQQGLCAICKNPLKKANTDHDHKSGLIRALLCWNCNKLLGQAYDNIERLMQAIEYLKNSNETFPASKALGAPRFGLPGRVGTKQQRRIYKQRQKKLSGN